jgi:6-pyruvoyltetrahydropterin/6-carboxytetrahydropterin synthase
LFKPVYQRIDHHRLNDIESLQSVAPADLAAWIYQRAHAVLPQVDRVDLYQTPGCGVIFKRFDASSAGVAA